MIYTLANLNSVFFRPWVGKNYEKGVKEKKILILGESHICGGCDDCGNLQIEDEECREFTMVKTLEVYLNYKKERAPGTHSGWMNTFTKFENEFYDSQLNEDSLLGFWDSVVFYNYVQYSTHQSRISPKEEEFENSKVAFFEVLAKYKPDLVIAWGHRLWDQLPSCGYYKDMAESSLINDGKGLYNYEVEGVEIPIMFVYHPSFYKFRYSAYKPMSEAINSLK